MYSTEPASTAVSSAALLLVLSTAAAAAPPPGSSSGPAQDAEGVLAEEPGEAVVDATAEAVLSFGEDLRAFPSRMWRDLRSLPTARNAVILSIAGGLAAASHEFLDDDVRHETAEHPRRFGRDMNHFLDNGGESYNHLAAAGLLYGASLFLKDTRLHELSLDLVHALSIEIPLVLGLKRAIPSERPDGAPRGFPSGHVASSFVVAAALHENYGRIAGGAGYTFASLVAFHRMDVGKHDLSDVVFGAALGWVIGWTVSENGTERSVEISPLADPVSGARGLSLTRRF